MASTREIADRHTVREIALTVGAVAGIICLIAATTSLLFGIKPLVFRSGSMSPAIETGALALAKSVPALDLSRGDIISVEGDGTRITHRVDTIESMAGGSMVVTLKGDANDDADASPYFVTEADRVFFHVNGLGYVVAWLSSPVAIFLGGVLVGGLLMVAFRPDGRREQFTDGEDSHTAVDEGVRLT
ncbi:signal peptidase I [Rhodococcus sp. H29-C3]|uniref:signal peptidase I n=1 Tax=Rhodococcus sp. H29-C3 TaxID=3046307 RepID=UPI0024BA62FD|nr:signal peptidase I [Rhodococcus sp. H29-C3]MDJ0359118.1 signal peptidase I [Rhodococcus sp. H29-C3]